MEEIESKGILQPMIVVMSGGKSRGIMVDSKIMWKVKIEVAVPVFLALPNQALSSEKSATGSFTLFPNVCYALARY